MIIIVVCAQTQDENVRKISDLDKRYREMALHTETLHNELFEDNERQQDQARKQLFKQWQSSNKVKFGFVVNN